MRGAAFARLLTRAATLLHAPAPAITVCPDLPLGRAPCAAAVKDAAATAASAEPAQSVLDRASTVLPLPWRNCTTTGSGVTARLFSLDHWWEVLFLRPTAGKTRIRALYPPRCARLTAPIPARRPVRWSLIPPR